MLLSVRASVGSCICSSNRSCFHPFDHLSVRASVHPLVLAAIRPSVCVSVWLCVCLSICLSVRASLTLAHCLCPTFHRRCLYTFLQRIRSVSSTKIHSRCSTLKHTLFLAQSFDGEKLLGIHGFGCTRDSLSGFIYDENVTASNNYNAKSTRPEACKKPCYSTTPVVFRNPCLAARQYCGPQ